MAKSIFLLAALGLSSACTVSGSVAPALTPVDADDVADGTDYAMRRTDPALLLAATGDFDGDGKAEEARFFKNQALGAFAVIVTWGDPARERTTVHADTLNNVAYAAVTALPPGPLRYICYGPVEGCDDRGRRMIETATDAVGVVYLGRGHHLAGKQVVYVWNGDGFNAYTIVD